jgi:uncharacterized membrane protein
VSATAQLSPPAPERDQRGLSTTLRDPILLGVGGLTLFAFFLRFSQIHQSLYGDEIWTYGDILGKSFRAVLTNVHTGGENSPPLFFLLAYATAKLGSLAVWMRLPSIVLGALTIPVLYLIGEETVGRLGGLLAGAIMALSPFSFYYGVEARPYATMAFFAALSTWALLRAVRSDRLGWWILYTLAAVAAAYSHYTAVFVLFAQGIWSLWVCRARIWRPLLSGGAAVILYIPWIPHLRGKELAVIGFLHPLTAHNVIDDLMRSIIGYPYAPLLSIPSWVGLVLVWCCFLAGAAFVLRSAIAARMSERAALTTASDHLPLLFVLAVITPIALLLYSKFETDLWLPRGLYASVPAASLVLAAVLLAIPKPFNIAAVVIVLGVLAYGTIQAARPEWQRAPTRQIASYLDRSASPSTPVAFVDEFNIGQITVMEQVHTPHHVVAYSALRRTTAPGSDAFVVVEDVAARAEHLPPVVPAPTGMRIVSHRHYASGLMPFDVVVYRRLG